VRIFLFLTLPLYALDQLTKQLILRFLEKPQPVIRPDIFTLVHVTNTGNVTLTNLAISNLDGLITFQNGPIASLAPGLSDDTLTGTHLIQSGETSLDESQIGQSDQVGNVVLPYHLDFVF